MKSSTLLSLTVKIILVLALMVCGWILEDVILKSAKTDDPIFTTSNAQFGVPRPSRDSRTIPTWTYPSLSIVDDMNTDDELVAMDPDGNFTWGHDARKRVCGLPEKIQSQYKGKSPNVSFYMTSTYIFMMKLWKCPREQIVKLWRLENQQFPILYSDN